MHTHQLLCPDLLGWTSLRPTRNPWWIQSRSKQKPASAARFFSERHPALSSGQASQAAELPDFKAGRAWRPLARKLRAAWGPCPDNRAGLPGRCRPTLAGTSLSTSFTGGQTGDASSGDRGGRRALSPACCTRGLLGWAGGRRPGKDLLGKREAHLPLPVTEVRRGGVRGHRRWAARSVGSGVAHSE